MGLIAVVIVTMIWFLRKLVDLQYCYVGPQTFTDGGPTVHCTSTKSVMESCAELTVFLAQAQPDSVPLTAFPSDSSWGRRGYSLPSKQAFFLKQGPVFYADPSGTWFLTTQEARELGRMLSVSKWNHPPVHPTCSHLAFILCETCSRLQGRLVQELPF